ncbi:hypothetical protein EDD59_11164 [Muricomes intestini]|uniref:Uncharacterized protein n=1 Tax=Muricomes intestini TaxID=1796634 RepID=A0A4R3K6S4_9FIRM|nr:hypothetical protein [Muricomes intestini]TCS78539.1 hypothetical protein EDD59_11164 [Muricomes intestini]
MAITCFRYFGFKSLTEVDQLTIPEYELLIEAHSLRMVDEEYKRHEQAFLNYQVQAQKSAGKYKTKPVYDSFEKFFDYDKVLARVKKKEKKPAERFAGIGKLLKKGGA